MQHITCNGQWCKHTTPKLPLICCRLYAVEWVIRNVVGTFSCAIFYQSNTNKGYGNWVRVGEPTFTHLK